MAESVESLVRRGMISSRQAERMGLKAQRGAKAQPSRMPGSKEERDEGAGTAQGAVSTNAINERDPFARPRKERNPLKPFMKRKGVKGQPRADEIDDREFQEPDFPAGTKPSKQKLDTPRRARGPVQPSGPIYGGPSSRRYG